VGIGQIAKETGLNRQIVYRIKGDPAGAEGALVVWGMRCEGPSDRRTADQRDEISPPHWCCKSLMANSKSVRRERSQINGQVSALFSVTQ
jgi:hypothetical protein